VHDAANVPELSLLSATVPVGAVAAAPLVSDVVAVQVLGEPTCTGDVQETEVEVLRPTTLNGALVADVSEPSVAVSVYPVPARLIAQPEKVATPAVAERGFAVHVNAAPDVPVAGVMVNVTPLVSDVTVVPLESCTVTTGWVVNATPAAAPAGDVWKASLTGTALTVNPLVSVTVPASGLVTVTSRAPATAFAAMVTLAVSDVAVLKVVEFTVIPEPENDTIAPDTNPLPVTVTFWFAAPCGRLFGLSEVTVGPAFTVKEFARVPTPASGLVTVTLD
jgi:hypothetical protein